MELNCTPKVRQYGILILTERGAVFIPKGKTNKKYTGDFKQKVVEYMIENKMSYSETARAFEVSQYTVVAKWERIYLAEGPEGLHIERRGRANAASGTKKGRPAKFPKQVEEDLLDEVQRLRAEVAYLKKLKALVLEEELQSKKHK